MRPRIPAALAALVIAATSAPLAASAPGDYCVDSSCPYYRVPIDLHVTIDYTMFPDREASGICYPVDGTGGRPGVVVYPILNMIVVSGCAIDDGVLTDGTLVGTVRRDAAYETPATVTVNDGSAPPEEADRVVCVSTGSGAGSSAGSARVQVYSTLHMYTLDACTIDWSSMASGRLAAFVTVSPIGA